MPTAAPGDEEVAVDQELAQMVNQTTEDISLWPHEELTGYVLKLDELLAMRRGVVLVGSPGCAKTTCIKVLHASKKLTDPEARRQWLIAKLKVAWL